MTEDKAINISLSQWEKRIIPTEEERDKAEIYAIQTIAMFYRDGYEIVPRFKPRITAGEIEQMKADSVIY